MIKQKLHALRVSVLMALTIAIFSIAACKKSTIENEAENKVAFAENIKTDVELKTDQTLILNPTIKGNAKSFQWVENDKVISTDNVYVFNRDVPGTYTLTLNVTNNAGVSSLVYHVKVKGIYADGILLISSTDKNGTGGGNISYLDENENLKTDVFSVENKGAKLSPSVMGAFSFNNDLYISATSGPNYITVLNNETLKQQSNITTSGITGVTYFATTDGKTGYINSSTRKKAGLYTVDFTLKSIASAPVTGTTDATLLPIATVNNMFLVPAAKQLVKVDKGVAQTLYTYTENVAGVVKTTDKQIWVGVQGMSNKAKFIRLDENFAVQETIELESTFKLPANGILTASGVDEFIYWQETSTGDFCRFNTQSKKAEKFVSPMNDGVGFATAWKVNPKTGELYIIDSSGIFTGLDSSSDLYIYDKQKKLRKKIAKAGYQVVDIIFPKK